MIAYIALGSNLGDRLDSLARAIDTLAALEGIRFDPMQDRAGIYETAPVDARPEDPHFLNTVVRVHTRLDPKTLLQACLRVESQLGRRRTTRNAPRIIDIDLLMFGDVIIDQPDLQVPHPRLHQRRFVLEPLCELAAQLVHPTLGETIQTLTDRARIALQDQHVRRIAREGA